MEYKGKNLCDFCFEPIAPGSVCPKCGLSHETYHAEAGLLLPGTNLQGKYIIGRVLGRGGFGATYLAYSSMREEVVAIKEYFPTGIATRAKGEERISIVSDDKRSVFEKGAKRFFDEAKTMARFNSNENVVSVYEFFYANDTVYYSMEYLEGIDLRGYIKKRGGKLSEDETVVIMQNVCDALVAVHSTQTLHRDVSPDNIFICTNGTVKLIDFGAAKQLVGEYAKQNYSVVVKQGFAPAEQYKSDGRQGVWTDIYAVGASMYYALTGEVPPDAMSRVENPEIVFDAALHISPEFTEIINKCLKVRIEERYQSAIELLGALRKLGKKNVNVGGDEYVQDVYKGASSTTLGGPAIQFDQNAQVPDQFQHVSQTGYNPYNQPNSQYPNSQYPPQYPNSQYQNPQYPNQLYPNSQYPNSQYPISQYPNGNSDSEKSGMIKGGIIAGAAVVIIALIVILIVTLFGRRDPQPVGPIGPGGNQGGFQQQMEGQPMGGQPMG